MSEELKPCPFCGHDLNKEDMTSTISAATVNDDLDEGVDGYYIYPSSVNCPNCGAGTIGGFSKGIDDAIKSWNRRVETSEPTEE